ncbi:hypothetical protein L5876_10915 [Hyphobacterium sp. SN044]|uniref:hypothetical protein n=1 Tax=Hyphobacterium sp. SN044 TaxID=2912575 RepID=UPI001F1F0C8F|nr:hypothetical protein [Hyphobacterium sp. SN044]MCF8880327.1 hypothetical protein [Hyphobacterium sp. SN044]
MKKFFAPEFQGLDYSIPPDVNYADTYSEAVSELTRIERTGGSIRYAFVSLSAANASRRIGRFDNVIEYIDRARVTFAQAGHLDGAAWSSWSRGNLLQQFGDHRAALVSFTASLKHAISARNSTAAKYALAGNAEVLRICGRYRMATQRHIELRDLFRSVQDYRGVVWAEQGLAQIALRQSDFGNAMKRFELSLEFASGLNDRRGIAWAKRGIAEVLHREGRHRSALNGAVEARAIFAEAGIRIGAAYAMVTSARCQIALRKWDEALQYLLEADREFELCRHARGLYFSGIEQNRLMRHHPWAAAELPKGPRIAPALTGKRAPIAVVDGVRRSPDSSCNHNGALPKRSPTSMS